MKWVFYSAPALGMAVACLAAAYNENWSIRDQGTIQKTFQLTQQPLRVVVDNVEGYVHVTGVDGTEVHVSAHKTIRAASEADVEQARSEVKLNMAERPGSVMVSYDAAWRCDGRDSSCRQNERRFYSVVYDIDVQVPRSARLVISAVNEGDVRVEKSSGDFEINDINGGIQMSEMEGSGSVHTINGPVSVRFAKNPAGACSFKSINGGLDVWFKPTLAADLLFKTFHGQVYSDFEVAPRAVRASVVTERRGGKFTYHSSGVGGGRAGNGGPELSFDTLNGSVRLHRAQ